MAPRSNKVGGGFDGIPDVENAQIELPAQSRGNQYNARVDWQVSRKDLIAGSLYFPQLDNLNASSTESGRPFDDVPFKPLNSAETLIWIHTFSAAWLNEVRGNATRFADNAIADSGNTVDYGIPYDNVQNYPFAIQYGVQASVSTPASFAENTYEVLDTATHTLGSHTVRAGYEFRFEQESTTTSMVTSVPLTPSTAYGPSRTIPRSTRRFTPTPAPAAPPTRSATSVNRTMRPLSSTIGRSRRT